MALDVTRVTVLGGSRKRVAARSPRSGDRTVRGAVAGAAPLRREPDVPAALRPSGRCRSVRQPAQSRRVACKRLAPRRRRTTQRRDRRGRASNREPHGLGRAAAVPVGDVARRVGQWSQGRSVHAPHDGAGVEAERASPSGGRPCVPRPDRVPRCRRADRRERARREVRVPRRGVRCCRPPRRPAFPRAMVTAGRGPGP